MEETGRKHTGHSSLRKNGAAICSFAASSYQLPGTIVAEGLLRALNPTSGSIHQAEMEWPRANSAFRPHQVTATFSVP